MQPKAALDNTSPVSDQGHTGPDDGLDNEYQNIMILMPAYNESGRVGKVVKEVFDALPGVDLVVIDDGSGDSTADEAESAGAKVLRLPLNIGYGAALQAGYKLALRKGVEYVGQLDADGQHDAVYLRKLLWEVKRSKSDVSVGSRFLDRDGHYRPTRARKLGMMVFSRIASMITRQHISDPTSGLQVMHIDVVRFFCTSVYPTDYPDADILILLHRSGFRIQEVGVKMRTSSAKSMHSGHRSWYYVYKMFLSIFVTLLRPRTGKS